MKGPELNESTVRNQEPSKLRQVIPQVFAVGAENLLLVTLGSTFGFTTILIGGLEANKTDISVDRDDISWISEYHYQRLKEKKKYINSQNFNNHFF